MSPYNENDCDFQRFLLFQNKARNAGRSRKNAGNKQKCGISRTIAGRLTPMWMDSIKHDLTEKGILREEAQDWAAWKYRPPHKSGSALDVRKLSF